MFVSMMGYNFRLWILDRNDYTSISPGYGEEWQEALDSGRMIMRMVVEWSLRHSAAYALICVQDIEADASEIGCKAFRPHCI